MLLVVRDRIMDTTIAILRDYAKNLPRNGITLGIG